MLRDMTPAEHLALLQAAVQYAVNRLDAENSRPQITGDLAIALAFSKSKIQVHGKP